ncbi:serine O-acetyltransferase [Avibacterium gallinarum]|uniref:serine O-acetyltransferase n=2 Tax=Avibacterium gallinarum TaxID=755 RepID=UPI0039FC2EFA
MLRNEIEDIVGKSIFEVCGSSPYKLILSHVRNSLLIDEILDDIDAFSLKDPASKNNPRNILYGYTSFNAVFYYRISHYLLNMNINNLDFMKNKYQYSLILSSKGKLLSGAEINPYAKIGKRFILDHGIGTVIGETAEIGDDCYMLGGVILGAKGISNNPEGIRHPRIGNNVQIGSFSKLFGAITIGNNVFIGSGCVITENIPDNYMVYVKTENQLIKGNS